MYKNDFPIFSETKTTYLDSAASAQKPNAVLRMMDHFYKTSYSNVHRGNCEIAVHATKLYEDARKMVADFLHTTSKNIIFTKGTTEAINLVATGRSQSLRSGDEVLVSISEHHANFVTWQQACVRTGATFKVFNVLPDGRLDMEDFKSKLTPKTKIVAITQQSNVLGVINPVKEITQLAHAQGAEVLVDGAQSIAHIPVDVVDLDCDFFVFSGHKLYGPTGIGVLYGKTKALDSLPPYQFGGDMVKEVTIEKTTFADVPARLEAGTTPFVEAAGLAAAIEYVSKIGMGKIAKHEQKLTDLLMEELRQIDGIEFLGGQFNTGLVSFNVKGVHPTDISFILSKERVCVRVGHHCAMPVHSYFGVPSSLRVSFGLYNDAADVHAFVDGFKKALSFF